MSVVSENKQLPANARPWLSMHITPDTPGSLILLRKQCICNKLLIITIKSQKRFR